MTTKYLTNEDPTLQSINTDVTDLKDALAAHVADNTNPHGNPLSQTDLKVRSISGLTPTSDIALGSNGIIDQYGNPIIHNLKVDTVQANEEANVSFSSPIVCNGVVSALGFTVTLPTKDNTKTKVVVLDDATGFMMYRDDIVGWETTDTLTNKTLSGASNTFTAIDHTTALTNVGTNTHAQIDI